VTDADSFDFLEIRRTRLADIWRHSRGYHRAAARGRERALYRADNADYGPEYLLRLLAIGWLYVRAVASDAELSMRM